jgi:hypothetical protein
MAMRKKRLAISKNAGNTNMATCGLLLVALLVTFCLP